MLMMCEKINMPIIFPLRSKLPKIVFQLVISTNYSLPKNLMQF